jgi:FKBP-type peptidyl-prolyl cis-trans isomerase FkpA
MKFIIPLILLLILIITSCRNKVQQAPVNFSAEKNRKNETLIKMNSYVAKRNKELISQFVKRTGLKMKDTGSGLWYEIYSEGNGIPVKQGDIVQIVYCLKLLDGSFIDSSTVAKPKSFRVGKGGVESGLEEGILLLHEGDHARFILPPHIAYGNFGNQSKIPPGAFLLYDLNLISVNP